jgi:dTMP kinase
MKGKLIVIDGGDGSGKTVQAKLLLNYLKKQGKNVMYADFPRYDKFFGKLINRYLYREFEDSYSISPYFLSLAYGLDRMGLRDEMIRFLKNGGVVISNRYTTSNMAHQSARLHEGERKAFVSWIKEFEYGELKLPEPDLVVYLHVPWKVGLELTDRDVKTRPHTPGDTADIAEADMHHREETEKVFLQLSKTEKNWVKVDCVDLNGKLMKPEEIHITVIKTIEKRIKI